MDGLVTYFLLTLPPEYKTYLSISDETFLNLKKASVGKVNRLFEKLGDKKLKLDEVKQNATEAEVEILSPMTNIITVSESAKIRKII